MSKKVTTPELECQNCSVALPSDKVKVCGRCMAVKYCSADCQAYHWKKGGHKEACKPYARPNDAPVGREVERCCVCLEGLAETSCTLPCTHTFHIQCAEDLREFGLNCPLCRAKLPESPAKMCEETTAEYLKIRRGNKRPDGTRRPYTKEQLAQLAELFRRMTEAAQQGHGLAQFNLGMFYLQGTITQKDEAVAVDWFHKSALNGCASAQSYMAQRCHKNNDLAGSAEWWLKAAEGNCPMSQYNYGYACFRGEGVPVDLDKAFYWWYKSADGGCPDAQRTLAQIKSLGVYGQAQDLPEAIRLFEKAKPKLSAEMVADTSFAIGIIFDERKDYTNAFPYLLTAAKNGSAEARFRISKYYKYGRAVSKDAAASMKWLRKAAEDGHADAQNNYAILLSDQGRLTEAFQWWEKAATQGLSMAQFNLSLAYNEGKGVAANETLYVKWCSLSAEQGHTSAQFNMGCYFHEQARFDFSFYWFNKAAGQGHLDSIYNLAAYYCEGLSVKMDKVKATKLCRMAAAKGHEHAIEKLKRVELKFTE
jgi:TPR repeat protein